MFSTLRWIAGHMARERKPLALLGALLLAAVGAQLAAPQALRVYVDGAPDGGVLRVLYLAAAGYAATALIGEALHTAAAYVGAQIAWRTTNRLRAALAGHTLRLDPSFHAAHTPGELLERIDGDVAGLAGLLSTMAGRLAVGVLLAIGILVMLTLEDVRLGAALLLFAGLYVLVHDRGQRLSIPHYRQEREANAALTGFLEERLAGLKDIRALGVADYTMRRLLEVLRPALRAEYRADIVTDVGWSISGVTYALGMLAAMGVGATLYQRGTLTIGSVYLVLHYLQLLREPLSRIGSEIQELQRGRVSLERTRSLLQTPLPRDDGRRPLPEGALVVSLRDVSFAYRAERRALDGVTLHVPAGQTLGLLGRTGSGKTTLTRLLYRFYEPDAGELLVGGVALPEVSRAELRRRVGLVTQDVQVLSASLRDNLTLYGRSVIDAHLEEALAALGLEGWYRRLPAGLDTLLGEGGRGMSAGEAQLVALTRVFLQDPGLVLLDEASSRLDPVTLRLLEGAMDRLLAGRTGILIAHRLATVQRTDAIAILEDGRVVEWGPREALVRDAASLYARLLRVGMEEVLA